MNLRYQKEQNGPVQNNNITFWILVLGVLMMLLVKAEKTTADVKQLVFYQISL